MQCIDNLKAETQVESSSASDEHQSKVEKN